LSGLFRGGFGRRLPSVERAPASDLVPRKRGPIEWMLPECMLYALDGRGEFLLRIDATIVNTSGVPVELTGARAADGEPAWDAPRAQWFENGSVRRAVFRVVPWLPCTLAGGEKRPGSRLLFVVAAERVPARGVAKIPLRLLGEPFGSLDFEARAEVPSTPRDAAAGI
jgi:hypothetical protein